MWISGSKVKMLSDLGGKDIGFVTKGASLEFHFVPFHRNQVSLSLENSNLSSYNSTENGVKTCNPHQNSLKHPLLPAQCCFNAA